MITLVALAILVSTVGSAPATGLAARETEVSMFHYALVFFVSALIASLLGFAGVAGVSVQIGWVCAVLALVFLAAALLSGRRGRGPIPVP